MIQLFYGDNDYARTQAVRRFRDEYLEKNGDQSVDALQGDAVTMMELPQILQGGSLFSLQTLTIITSLSTNKSVWEGLSDFLESAGDIDLLLVETKPDKRTRTFKWLQKNAEVREFKPLDEREVANWLRTHARTYGIELHHDEAAFLVQYSGVEQWRLHHDIEKLALAGKPVSRQLIEELIDPNPSASVFDLLDAIIAGKRDYVQEKVTIIKHTEDPYKFIGLLVSQLYALSVCKAADHKSSQTIAKEAGIHPYVAQKTLTVAQKVSDEKLRRMVDAVMQCDELIKTSGNDPWSMIELSLAKMST